MKFTRQSRLTSFVLAACASAALSACGGGGSNSPTVAGAAASPATTMAGTVAIGHALTNATITVIDAQGKTAIATSGTGGTYSVSISGLTAPFFITANDPSGASENLYSWVSANAAIGGAPIVANVTPLTTAVVALLTADGNPLDFAQAGAWAAVTPTSLAKAVATLDAAISPILSANGLSATSFDPIGTAFVPDQTGADAVIDSVAVTSSASGTGLQITSLADPNTAVQLNNATPVSTVLQAPTQPANYLAALVAQLQQCVSGAAASCSNAIDAGYLSDGASSMQQNHPEMFAAGAKVTGVKTVAFLPANTLANISSPAALVAFLYQDANGKPGTATEVVQQQSGTNWDVIGNQEQYNLNITSFVGRLQFTDSADANNARLEAGLDIQIPADIGQVVGGSGQQQIASALVQGPGLPSAGLYLLSPLNGLGPYLTIPAAALTAPYPLCSGCSTSTPNGGMSTQYKWSWSTLTGTTGSWSPQAVAEYATQPIDVSTISQYSVYTVTLYDMTGTPIGQPQKVLDTAANVSAASGASVAWQTLGSDVIANLLTPGGSSTSVTGSAPVTIDWTAPTNGAAYPNFWASINSLGEPVVSGGVQTIPAQPYDTDSFVMPGLATDGVSYSETFPQGFVDVLTSTSVASAEQAVQVQLNWQANNEHFRNIWQFNN